MFTALVPGIVKNIRVTTVGGVLGPGEELMQIVPVEDELLIESRVSPADIARVAPGLMANIRFDPFDYTIYGRLRGKVVYVSADTLKEQSEQGTQVYYRVHVKPDSVSRSNHDRPTARDRPRDDRAGGHPNRPPVDDGRPAQAVAQNAQ